MDLKREAPYLPDVRCICWVAGTRDYCPRLIGPIGKSVFKRYRSAVVPVPIGIVRKTISAVGRVDLWRIEHTLKRDKTVVLLSLHWTFFSDLTDGVPHALST